MAKLTLDEVALSGRRALTRVDFNVPLEDGRITDDTRIREALPTIRKIIGEGAKAVLMSHLGRPKGARDPRYSLAPIARHLEGLIEAPVAFCEQTVGAAAREAVEDAPGGGVILLENTRFHAGETKNDPELSRQLSELGDLYVNDAFGAAHRAHASTVGVTAYLQPAVMGYLLRREVERLSQLLEAPARPFLAVLGGAKVSDKLGVIVALLDKVDRLLLGGAMAYTFLRARGEPVGSSRVEEDLVDEARRLLDRAQERIVLPEDHVIAEAFANDARHWTAEGGFDQGMGLDIGPLTRGRYREAILGAQTVLWNGPMGVFEMPSFAAGTLAVAEAMAEATRLHGAETVVGGGDSVAAIVQAGHAAHLSHVSTGGGAMLEFIEGRELPGIAALTDA